MKKYALLLLVLIFVLPAIAQKKSNELAISVAPLNFKKVSNYQMMYRRSIDNNLKLRAGLKFSMDTDKELRNDTVTLAKGTVQYDISFGIQKDLSIGDLDKVTLYIATDGYWDSRFNREAHETYYGYFWSFGLKPSVGIAYEPFNNIRLSFESRANFNVNLQEYSAPGENKDTRYSFKSLDQLAVNIGYLF